MLFLLFFGHPAIAETYMNREEFLDLVIKKQSANSPSNVEFKTKTLWLKKEIQFQIKNILDHKYPKLRIRYKIDKAHDKPNNSTTVWYLDEIGKERPISFGISIRNNKIQIIRVLEFRESRGYEIRIPAFSEQFEQVGLNETGKLNQDIDGITGATMSVNAMKKIAQVALLLHKIVLTKDLVQ